METDDVASLFGEDRGTDVEDVTLRDHVSIHRHGPRTTIVCGDQSFRLSPDEVDEIVDELDGETIWWIFNDREQLLEILESKCGSGG